VQVESKDEFLVKPLVILDQREVMFWKRVITQVKVQWQHFGSEEATWEDKEVMRETCPDLFATEKHQDDV